MYCICYPLIWRTITLKIRKAVGAIIKTGNKFILVHKVKIMNSKNGPEDIPGRWDFPKGGVKSSDMNLNKAILRELKEETGSDQYKIIKEFNEKISFQFPQISKRNWAIKNRK